MARTPAIVAAERAGISFSVHAYEHDPNAASYGLEAVERPWPRGRLASS